MSAESPRHMRVGGPLTIPSQPPSDRSLIDTVSGFINDVTLSSASIPDIKDSIQWARFEIADVNEPSPEGDHDTELAPLLLILGYGSGVQVWLISPNGEAQEVLSWRQGSVRVLRILPTPNNNDAFLSKRPLIGLCDSASPGPTFCSLSFISVRGGEQVKSIKFKNPILDVLANKRSVVVAFSERFAVFDSGTLEDRLAVTTCYPCPCPLGGSASINPLALGDRWLAYADRKINQSKRSSGGCEGEGVSSYTATVLHAAKSLSKGLRGLSESVASSLAGGRNVSQSPSPPNADIQQPGIITILDIEASNEDDNQDASDQCDPIVAHFIAHSDAIIALKFDASGMLLVTADRRGHDFHVFRINPHPCGPSLASVHHLYILHRGDTTAKVQDIAISPDSRWTAVSTLRGTTHVFPISPYGGSCGVRTHMQPRVVNRLSRFHRSAGLPIHAHTTSTSVRSSSPVGDGMAQGAWFPNPRLPPYPLSTTITPLAQLRPTAAIPTHTITRNSSGRQRLSSLSEDTNIAPLLARACFGVAPLLHTTPRPPAAHALYLMTANGCLIHYLLHPRPATSIPKEKLCDDSPIELEVEPVAQWPLQRPQTAADLLAPLPPTNPLLQSVIHRNYADVCISEEERWLAQVEIVTHAGPHRRLWMGPQFVFKTYNCTGSNSSLSEVEAVEVDTSAASSVARSNPVNMPGVRPIVPVLVDSGSASSLEHSPSETFRRISNITEGCRAAPVCEVQLREDLAEAMKEDQGWFNGDGGVVADAGHQSAAFIRAVDPLGTVVVPAAASEPTIEDPDLYTQSNSDEASFRPVVRAPASIPPHPNIVVCPLPVDTKIPVQTVFPSREMSPEGEPLPLKSEVVIPAALSVNTKDTHVNSENKMTSNDEQSDIYVPVKKDLMFNKDNYLNSKICLTKIQNEDKELIIGKNSKWQYQSPNLPLPKPNEIAWQYQSANLPLPKPNEYAQGGIPYCSIKSDINDTPSMNVSSDNVDVLKMNKCDSDYYNSSVEVTVTLPSKDVITEGISSTYIDKKNEELAWDMLLSYNEKCTSVVGTDDCNDKNLGETKSKNRRWKKNKSKIYQKDINIKKSVSNRLDSQVCMDNLNHISTDLTEPLLDKNIGSSAVVIDSCENKHITEKNYKENNYSNPLIENLDISSRIECETQPKNVQQNSDLLQYVHDVNKYSENETTFKNQNEEHERNSKINPLETHSLLMKPISDEDLEIEVISESSTAKTKFNEIAYIDKLIDEQPRKLWSAVAARKSEKKYLLNKTINEDNLDKDFEEVSLALEPLNNSKHSSLQEKLFELCKRADIMVAECDAPTELNFVEDHHSMLHDLPPLEPLDFSIDNFKLDDIRDSLLDVQDCTNTSAICKINIDEILFSIKDTSNKLDSSSNHSHNSQKATAIVKCSENRNENYLDNIENDNISHGISLQINSLAPDSIPNSEEKKVTEILEKSSDDDNTSPISSQTDSDKDDKKNVNSLLLLPSQKQTGKKKSRRKKK